MSVFLYFFSILLWWNCLYKQCKDKRVSLAHSSRVLSIIARKSQQQNWSHCSQTWETERVDALLPVVSAFSPRFLQSAQGRVLSTMTVVLSVSPTGMPGDAYAWWLYILSFTIKSEHHVALRKTELRYFFSVQKDTYVNSCSNYVICLWMFWNTNENNKEWYMFSINFQGPWGSFMIWLSVFLMVFH